MFSEINDKWQQKNNLYILFSPLLGLEKNIQYVIVIITEETGGYSKWLKSDTVQNSLNR